MFLGEELQESHSSRRFAQGNYSLFTIYDSPTKLLVRLLRAFPFAEKRSGSGCSGLHFVSVLIILQKGVDSAPVRLAAHGPAHP